MLIFTTVGMHATQFQRNVRSILIAARLEKIQRTKLLALSRHLFDCLDYREKDQKLDMFKDASCLATIRMANFCVWGRERPSHTEYNFLTGNGRLLVDRVVMLVAF